MCTVACVLPMSYSKRTNTAWPLQVQFRSTRQGRPQASQSYGRGSLHKSLHQQDILDHETGQTGTIPIVGDSSQSSVRSNTPRHISPAVEDYDGPQSNPKHCSSAPYLYLLVKKKQNQASA